MALELFHSQGSPRAPPHARMHALTLAAWASWLVCTDLKQRFSHCSSHFTGSEPEGGRGRAFPPFLVWGQLLLWQSAGRSKQKWLPNEL